MLVLHINYASQTLGIVFASQKKSISAIHSYVSTVHIAMYIFMDNSGVGVAVYHANTYHL